MVLDTPFLKVKHESSHREDEMRNLNQGGHFMEQVLFILELDIRSLENQLIVVKGILMMEQIFKRVIQFCYYFVIRQLQ